MKLPIFIICISIICCSFLVNAQNVGIGGANPTRARLEVAGTFGVGNTTGLFGGDQGISVQQNLPAIGFNQYRDDASPSAKGRYMNNGFAATMNFIHNDVTYATGFELKLAPSGVFNNVITSEISAIQISPNGRFRILPVGISGGGYLQVGRGTGFNGTAVFSGSTYASHFNFSTEEHTYIRAGVNTGSVLLHPETGGAVVFGNTSCRVGINAPNPQYALEFRQVAETGLLIRNGREADGGQPWEWRVIGATGVFSLRYNNAARVAIEPTMGAYSSVSDERLKTDFIVLAPVMERLLQLRPVSYEFLHDNPNHVRSLGFLAQEVEPVFPELVETQEVNSQPMKLLQYSGFGVLAIKGVQEQQGKLNALMNSAKNIDERIQQLRKRFGIL